MKKQTRVELIGDDKKFKKELYKYLDVFSFVEEEEVQMAVCDFLGGKEKNLSWFDVMICTGLAKDYIEKRKLTF